MLFIPIAEANSEHLADLLEKGQIIVYPTETCYGLGCDATNSAAVQKIFRIKERQQEKSMLVLMPDVAMARRYVWWSAVLDALAEKYWPGAVTVVAPAKENTSLAPGIVAADGTLAFRITSHPFAEEISRCLGKPLVSTSANIAAMESPYDIARVRAMFEAKEYQPDMVIDAGELAHRNPSTIVRIGESDSVEVLRQGDVVVSI